MIFAFDTGINIRLNAIFVLFLDISTLEMAGRTKGTSKTGGRKKGTPNKVSKDAKEWAKKFVCGNATSVERAWRELPDDSPLKFQFFIQMMRYVVPIANTDKESNDQKNGSTIDKTIDDMNSLK